MRQSNPTKTKCITTKTSHTATKTSHTATKTSHTATRATKSVYVHGHSKNRCEKRAGVWPTVCAWK